MAQTKRKRRSKHRGTPAGTIEARGRTGRPPTAQEKKQQARATAREKRLNTPPTWKSAATRAAIAVPVVFVLVLLTSKGKGRAAVAALFTIVAFALYVPAGYYMDLFLYRRRQRQKAQGR